MASRRKSTITRALDALKEGAKGCSDKLPATHSKVIPDIQDKASSIGTEMSGPSSSASSEDVNKFLVLLETTTKKLVKLRKNPKRKVDDTRVIEGLQKSLKDLSDFLTRVKKSDSTSVTASSILTRAEARTFWIESFSNKDLQVDWDRWLTAYKTWDASKSFTLKKESERLLQSIIGSSGGKIVTASRMNEACVTFGFPFKRVKCCREMDCDCMEYKRKMFEVAKKRQSLGPTLCMDCGHEKNKHFDLEKLDEETKHRAASGSAIQEKATMVLDSATGFGKLHRSVLQDNLEVASSIIKDMADVNEPDKKGCTALHTAVRYSSPGIVNLLLKHGADSKLFDKDGYAPVHTAARLGNLPAVKALVAHDPANAELEDMTEDKAKPLHHAAEENRTSVIEFLSSRCNADINATNSIGESAVFVAAACDNPETIATAAKLGANLTLRSELDEAPMDIAAKEGSVNSIVAIAQKAPEAVSAEDDEGNPPLSQCFVGEAVDMLVNLGANPEHKNNEGRTPLHATATDPDRLNASRMLLLRGADPNAKDDAGQTALHIAVSMDNEQTVDMLVDEGGADIDARDNQGTTPLLLALDRQFENLSLKILDKGANVSTSDCRGLSALHYSAKNGYERLLKRLVDMGAVIDSLDITGKTPLHYAVINSPELAKSLVDMGAHMYIRDAQGDTPLGLSVKSGKPLKRLTVEEVEVLRFTETSKEGLVVPPGPTCPWKCFADGPGLKDGHVSTRYSFTVFACDETGKLRTEGGDALSVRIQGASGENVRAAVGALKQSDKRLTAKDSGNGTYAIAYQLEEAGSHRFHITISGEPIQGSPYSVALEGSRAPPPSMISSTQYSAERYEERTIEFAKESGIGQVDVAIVCDTTSSMNKVIDSAQRLMQGLVDAINDQDLCNDLRLALIAYRDHPPEDSTYVTKVWRFTSDVPSVRKAIDSLSARGGGDIPEAIADALNELFHLNWDETLRPHAVRMAVLIGDAPPHGMIGHQGHYTDNFPDGCPDGHDWLILAEQCHSKGINIHTILCSINLKIAEQAFSAIANSSRGLPLQMKCDSNNDDVITLIKLAVQDQLDKRLTYSTVSDVIIKKPLNGKTFEKRMASVSNEMSTSGFKVRRLQTDRNVAAIRVRSVCVDDVYMAVEDFKLCERLALTTGDRGLMDHMGKNLYALKKIEGTLPAVPDSK